MNQGKYGHVLSLDFVNQPIALDEQLSNRFIAHFRYDTAPVGDPAERARSRSNRIDESSGIASEFCAM